MSYGGQRSATTSIVPMIGGKSVFATSPSPTPAPQKTSWQKKKNSRIQTDQMQQQQQQQYQQQPQSPRQKALPPSSPMSANTKAKQQSVSNLYASSNSVSNSMSSPNFRSVNSPTNRGRSPMLHNATRSTQQESGQIPNGSLFKKSYLPQPVQFQSPIKNRQYSTSPIR